MAWDCVKIHDGFNEPCSFLSGQMYSVSYSVVLLVLFTLISCCKFEHQYLWACLRAIPAKCYNQYLEKEQKGK